ncbi:MAG: response regulator [Desulfuromonadales bacterium]|nr:response regulator [Desulfuromonadales bacterium]MDW7758512.1 response regulator [Desulfuromonadales bacterium]
MNQKPTVLVADRDEDFLAQVGALLDRMDFKVLPVKNGAELLDAVNVMLPDIILVDVDLPEPGGLSSLKALKEAGQLSRVPVVLVSEKADMGIYRQCQDYGPCSFLMKPLLVEELHSALQLVQVRDTGGRKRLRAPFKDTVVVRAAGRALQCPGVTLSEGGVCVQQNPPLPVGAAVEVVLALPTGGPLTLGGRVSYVQQEQAGGGDGPSMAIVFDPVSAEVSTRVREFVILLLVGDMLDEQGACAP